MVNGMLMDTEEEISSNPTADVKGFFSGLARFTIARKDDAVLEASPPEEGITLDRIERFGLSDRVETLFGLSADNTLGFWLS
jgi:hypothetical protein